MSVLITKADGAVEPYNPHKLLESLERAGAAKDAAHDIERQIEKELYAGVTTQEIYRRAFARLREAHRGVAARYSLKRALLELGPSGFPFEAYIARLYQAEGYAARTDQIVRGACVEHEVDVVLEKGEETTYVEAKFHNTAGFKTDLKVTLYVKARLDDIAALSPAESRRSRGIIVTNTKFTDKALQFAACAGIGLLGWETPQGQSLQDKIERAGLHPVTALTSLSHREKTALLGQNIVLCRDLLRGEKTLQSAGLSGHKAQAAMEEAGALCMAAGGLQ